MTPSEVIAMRDKLTEWFKEVGWIGAELEMELADKMIREGWVVAPPKSEGEERMRDAVTGKEVAAIPPKDRVYTCQLCSKVSMDNEQFRLIQFLGIAFVICFDCILGDQKDELERAAAEKALLRFEDRLLLELEATERAGIDLGQDYLHGMRSCLSQIGDEAKVYAYRREETE